MGQVKAGGGGGAGWLGATWGRRAARVPTGPEGGWAKRTGWCGGGSRGGTEPGWSVMCVKVLPEKVAACSVSARPVQDRGIVALTCAVRLSGRCSRGEAAGGVRLNGVSQLILLCDRHAALSAWSRRL